MSCIIGVASVIISKVNGIEKNIAILTLSVCIDAILALSFSLNAILNAGNIAILKL